MNAIDYQSFATAWEDRATIRTRPRRILENDDRLIYPLSRQPLVLGATFMRECSQWRDFVLVQSLYKFINDVVIFETEIVDRTARAIAKNRFAIRFPFACRYDAMTVDEVAAEAGMAIPTEPVVFTKAISCIQGPDDDVMLPKGSKKSDWEVELGVVIGRDYPAPLVDHAQARNETLARYAVVKAQKD